MSWYPARSANKDCGLEASYESYLLIAKCGKNLTIHIYFIYNALHLPNELVRLLLHVKLASTNSVFAEKKNYLNFKYQITREDWNKPHAFLLGKVKFKTPLHVQSTCQTRI